MGVFRENRYFLPPNNPQHLQGRGMPVGLRSLGTSEGRTNACWGPAFRVTWEDLQTGKRASVDGRADGWQAGPETCLYTQGRVGTLHEPRAAGPEMAAGRPCRNLAVN